MIPGATAFSATAIAAWIVISPSVAQAVDPASLVDDAICLVEIDVYEGTGVNNLPPEAIGAVPLSSPALGASISTGVTTLTYADATWIGEPGDPDKPNGLYLGRALTPFQYERDCPIVPEQQGRLQLQYGQTVLAAGDGELDNAVKNFAIAGRSVRVRRGMRSVPLSTPYANHSLVLSALATGWSQDENQITIDLRDTAYKLDLPLQSVLYAGTGGAEGDAQFAGKPKPFLAGFVRNITPDFIDAANLVFAFHFRQAQAVVAVRDLGDALPIDADYPTYAALTAASIASGHCATCLAQGVLRVETKPTGLTIDAQGDAAGSYADTHAGIARKLLTDLCGLSNGDFVSSSFGAWPSGTAGIYFGSDDTSTGADALNKLAASAGGWWGPGRDGRIAAGRLFDPAAAAIDLYVGLADIRGPIQVMALPALPRYRQRVGYQALQTTQDSANLAGLVSASDRAFYSQSYRSVTSIDASVQVRYPLAADFPVLVTLFDGVAQAQTLADYLLGLHKAERRMFRIPLGPLGFLLDLGKVVNVIYPRLGLEGGQPFVVVGTIEDAAGVDVVVWG